MLGISTISCVQDINDSSETRVINSEEKENTPPLAANSLVQGGSEGEAPIVRNYAKENFESWRVLAEIFFDNR